jgi:histidinol phosphatase-like PHP family hydrolase
MAIYDFHTHTFLSDGVLSPIELIRRAHVKGYRVIGITDHAGEGELEWVLKTLSKDCALANSRWDILALPGVELTHVPVEDVDRLAQEARRMGAKTVVVHGETVVEPVPPGTNRAAAASKHVDIIAHPGLISSEDARLAAATGVRLEISARRGHSLTNGHVAKTARDAGAAMVLDSDAHGPEDLLTEEFAKTVALGAGLTQAEARTLLDVSPRAMLKKLGLAPS